MRPLSSVLGVAAICTLGCGCTVYEYAGAGGSTAASGRDGHTGGQLDFVAGIGRIPVPESPVAITLGSHFNIAERTTEFAPSIGVEASPRPLLGRLVPFAGLGVRPLAFGLADGRPGSFGGRDFSFSVFSPQADLGLMVLLTHDEDPTLKAVGGWTLVLRGSAQYDVRVTYQPNQLYLGLTLGPGFYFSAF